MILSKKCIVCEKVFEKVKFMSVRDFENKKYCSRKCYYEYLKTNGSWIKGKTKETSKEIGKYAKGMVGNKRMQNYLKGGGKHPMKGLKQSEEWKTNISKGNKGKKHWNYQDGKTEPTQLLRKHREYQKWRIKVLERDNYVCQHCGSKTDYRMVVHHIKGFKEYPELGYEVSNGKTLCNSCHTKLHKN